MNMQHVLIPGFEKLASFVFWYPFIMSLFWIAGTLIYIRYRDRDPKVDFSTIDWPLVSFLVPCYNEEETMKKRLSTFWR